MNSRRDFLKHMGLLGAGGMFLSDSIRRAFAIDPAPGSSWMDAEHVVILMQENRSFDHLYGTLRGVRGFDDPRAIQLPNGNPVWLQTNNAGQTFAPFRLDIKETKITWLGSLPHGWTDQTDARNGGKHDAWLEAKKTDHQDCRGMPLTLGAYTRADLPFYFDLADAFTICDQHFCSTLTGTMSNRAFLWSGTNRGTKDASAPARLNNGEIEYEDSCHWKTFPDRLEDLGVSWKVYQNEISAVDVGLEDEAAAWLANYGDNPLEWFPQFHVGFVATHRARLAELVRTLPGEIENLESQLRANPSSDETAKKLNKAKTNLHTATERLAKFTPERFDALPQREKNLHAKGLTTNTGDPDYRTLATLRYKDGAVERELQIPKGDVLHQFRRDVAQGQLPTVSWIVAPENFSDHPSSAWYGAWYVSEVLNILTQNPEVWRKTIFVLTYDENDGYFDHVPPFVAPHPLKPETGLVGGGISTAADFMTMEEELASKRRANPREGPMGLGFRVPLVIASPWSRGGYVCSEVFDHTSPLQFLEKFLSKKLGKTVEEPNISDWRRTVCGDLTSSFRPYHSEKIPLPPFLQKEPFAESIHQARFKPVPSGFKAFSPAEIRDIKKRPARLDWKLRQEPGTRPACGLPYDLQVHGAMNATTKMFDLSFEAKKERFGSKTAGVAFNVYAPGLHKAAGNKDAWERCRVWNLAVQAGGSLKFPWNPRDFENGQLFLRVYGPNGFFREFQNDAEPPITVSCEHQGDRDLVLMLAANDQADRVSLEILDNAYGASPQTVTLARRERRSLTLSTDKASGWYDFTVRSPSHSSFSARFAGHLENGKESISDPVIGQGL